MINEIIGIVFMVVGSIFYVLAGLGLIRMPDVYNRIQAGTKATTLGTFSVILGVGIYEPSWLVKALIIIVFISLTNPIGSSVLAKAAYIRKEKVVDGTTGELNYFDERGEAK
ncbi:MAG: Na+/H+ antiporter subunit G [Firmicutes bacterium HGW-Firmicutes-5]|nr:monovalent cation/H(+) antiporter subunit G [Vallitaleaceae bacterium]PKM56106.1 MAG: Na+/H+ antiporter subunit G [Firmicutes bacterium HGW-Firmicutes-5]